MADNNCYDFVPSGSFNAVENSWININRINFSTISIIDNKSLSNSSLCGSLFCAYLLLWLNVEMATLIR
jgi:hypothetical protein